MGTLSESATYILYYSLFISTVFLSMISSLLKKYKKKYQFWLGSVSFVINYLTLTLVVGLRAYGIDHTNYHNMYTQINESGFSYKGFPEPLFYLINKVVSFTTGNFLDIYLICAILTFSFFFAAFKERIGVNSYPIIVSTFFLVFYFYSFGLIRMLVSVSLLTYAHKYLCSNNLKKYLIYGIIAGGFHYSAFVIVPIIIFSEKLYRKRFKFREIFGVYVLLLPLLFIIFTQLFKYFIRYVPWLYRYSDYLNLNFEPAIIKNYFWILPAIIILMLFGKQIREINYDGEILINLFCLLCSLMIISSFFRIFRLTFYLYYPVIYIYGSLFKLSPFKKNREIIVVFWIFFVIFGFFYLREMFFDSIYIDPFIIPFMFRVLTR
ncbi:EpsG family protein [Vagococcus elongatus]|uniref:EpsG family protein n=1 Tax=Vagococcus elongatus TaxID=180344 RepID=A0A430B1R4_9ENTE|nr:EpsG family protein [Vagococcus elongatus]RSU14260.1 hypothetical protein CBF29_02860 [Vagococcus elongatus]